MLNDSSIGEIPKDERRKKRSLGRFVITLYFQNVKILTAYFGSTRIRRAGLTGRKSGKPLTLFHGQNEKTGIHGTDLWTTNSVRQRIKENHPGFEKFIG